jgi:hypothetical protein
VTALRVYLMAMKPETLARRAVKRAAAVAERHATLITRLSAKVAEHGQDSIWAEMLAALRAQVAK